jgi:hypothetical protein
METLNTTLNTKHVMFDLWWTCGGFYGFYQVLKSYSAFSWNV